MKQYAMYKGKAYTLVQASAHWTNLCGNCAVNEFGLGACLNLPGCKTKCVYVEYTPQEGDVELVREETNG